MNVYVKVLVKVRVNPQFLRPRPYIAYARPGGFLHHVAQLAGKHQFPAALHGGHLYGQRLAAHRCPCQPRGNAHLGTLLNLFVAVGGYAKVFTKVCPGHPDPFPLLLHQLLRGLPAHVGYPSLQVSYPRFPGVIVYYIPHGVFRDEQVLLLKTVLFKLLGQQVLEGYVQFLLLGVAGDIYYLHAVQQRPRYGVGGIGRCNEHHLGQVKGHLQVVVPERVVLLRVQHLQHGRRGVAPEVVAHLVNLVQQKHRVLGTGLAHGIYYPAGDGAHVGAPVTANLRLVPHPAQRHPDKLPV